LAQAGRYRSPKVKGAAAPKTATLSRSPACPPLNEEVTAQG